MYEYQVAAIVLDGRTAEHRALAYAALEASKAQPDFWQSPLGESLTLILREKNIPQESYAKYSQRLRLARM